MITVPEDGWSEAPLLEAASPAVGTVVVERPVDVAATTSTVVPGGQVVAQDARRLTTEEPEIDHVDVDVLRTELFAAEARRAREREARAAAAVLLTEREAAAEARELAEAQRAREVDAAARAESARIARADRPVRRRPRAAFFAASGVGTAVAVAGVVALGGSSRTEAPPVLLATSSISAVSADLQSMAQASGRRAERVERRRAQVRAARRARVARERSRALSLARAKSAATATATARVSTPAPRAAAAPVQAPARVAAPAVRSVSRQPERSAAALEFTP